MADLKTGDAQQRQEFLDAGWSPSEVDSLFEQSLGVNPMAPLPPFAPSVSRKAEHARQVSAASSEKSAKQTPSGSGLQSILPPAKRQPLPAIAIPKARELWPKSSTSDADPSPAGNKNQPTGSTSSGMPSKTGVSPSPQGKAAGPRKFFFRKDDESYYSRVKQYDSVADARKQLGQNVPVKQVEDEGQFNKYLADLPTADDPFSEITKKTHSYMTGKDFIQHYLFGELSKDGQVFGWVIRAGDTDQYYIYYK